MKKRQNIRVVIVGGGFGGVKTALELSNKPGFEVTLISNTTNFEYHGALYRTATGNSPMEVVIPLREIFERSKNVDIVLDSIAHLYPESRAIKSETGTIYEYDALVLALGNEINYFGLEDMESKTFSVNTIRHTMALRHEFITQFKSGKSVSVAVVGGGPSGVELAGEIKNFARKVTHKYGRAYHEPRVMLIEGTDRLLPMFDPKLSAKVEKRLKKLGVDVHLNTKVDACEKSKICLSSGDIATDIIVWTAGSKIPDFYAVNEKCFTLERGRIVVDKFLRVKGQKDIFIIGDNAATKYSGMAQTALYDAKFLARNFVRIRKNIKPLEYQPRKPVYIVPVGDNWAVMQSGRRKVSGYNGWRVRRKADLAILRNFEPYKQALKRWRRGTKQADY